jgi:hypothetical protein
MRASSGAMAIAPDLPARPRRISPYSKRLERGILAGIPLDGRTLEGKFAKRIERDLLEHIGHPPNAIERLLIRQCVRIQLQLDHLNAKLTMGDFTDHDRRTFGALNNAFRLNLRELVSPVPARSHDERRKYADPHAEVTRLVAERRGRKAQPEAAE